MYPIRLSPKNSGNSDFKALARPPGEANLDWFERARRGRQQGVTAAVLLFGGADVAHFRLRMAQSVARHDLTPSHWSHAALVERVDQPLNRTTRLWEIPLSPARGFGWPPSCNGLRRGYLRDYDSTERFPNVALIGVPADPEQVRAQLNAFERRPLEIDAVSLLAEWLAYLWGASGASNPLERGMGLPSAVLVEAVVSAAWHDLSPGLASLASCPEAIWQAAKHWSCFHAEASGGDGAPPHAPKVLTGFHHAEHRLVPE